MVKGVDRGGGDIVANKGRIRDVEDCLFVAI